MLYESKKALTLLLVIICGAFLTSCAEEIKEHGGVSVSRTNIPASETLTEGEVGVTLLRLQTEAQQCKANFVQ